MMQGIYKKQTSSPTNDLVGSKLKLISNGLAALSDIDPKYRFEHRQISLLLLLLLLDYPLLLPCRSAIAAVYSYLRYIIMSLEAIAFGTHSEFVEVDLREWIGATRTDASSLLTGITQFDFIVCFAITYTLLSGLAGITQKLQGRGLDIFRAYQMVCNGIKGRYDM